MTVEEFSDLRKSLREVDASYTLAKKTIVVKAIKEALNIDIEVSSLEGQV
jgi:ribosomal protein L10